MSSSFSTHLPLYEKIIPNVTEKRIISIVTLCLQLSVLHYRLSSLHSHGLIWLLAFLCEFSFTFFYILGLVMTWTPVDYKTYPENFLTNAREFPRVDMFVTTTDPALEPPILTVNTVLSLLAVDYPADKLACYVSDDGCSLVTFYSLVEASKFARIWVPFCKKYNIQLRAPFRYFSVEESKESSRPDSLEFRHEWKKMKDGYGELCRKIQEANSATKICESEFSAEYEALKNVDRTNHSSIDKVIWENEENQTDGVPSLIYVSREKRPNVSHHYKAGAMNALTRVSAVMTNAPYMLNVDCDMYANNSKIVLHAMCLLLGLKHEDPAFVQFPQMFYDQLKDDPFGNQMTVAFKNMGLGMQGIQGVCYAGTGCFHRRKVIYGLAPEETKKDGNLFDKTLLRKQFGSSTEEDFIESVLEAISQSDDKIRLPRDLKKVVCAASAVSGCFFENSTGWGTKFGWMYGSATEDVLTGMKIHARGWKSCLCTPEPPGFLGCAPPGGPIVMTQRKRWTTGLLQILFNKQSPIVLAFTTKLRVRQSLVYLLFVLWNLTSIPEICYAILPAYSVFTNSSFLPKVQEPMLTIFVTLFFINYLQVVSDFIQCGCSVRSWWNHMRMGKIVSMSATLFGILGLIPKLLGLSETVFEVTQKDQGDSLNFEDGRFTFDKSTIFVPPTAILFLHLTAVAMWIFGLQPQADGGHGSGLGEIACSVWVVLCLWPFVKGLFGKGKYGIPFITICKSAVIALIFVHMSQRGLRNSTPFLL